MTEANAVTLTLELGSGGEPIDGRVRYSDGAERSFIGWAGLIAAIDGVRAGERANGEDSRGAGA